MEVLLQELSMAVDHVTCGYQQWNSNCLKYE
jgi:hypothetical protein